MSDVEKESVVERLRGRTTVNNAGRGMIRIDFKSNDPKMAFRGATLLAELFIDGSHEEKLEQSKAAYEFIDKQVAEYRERLQAAEETLKQLRTSNIQAGIAGGETNIILRINQVMTRIDQVKEQLRDAEIKKNSLERQLSGESESAVVVTRAGRLRARISELQAQLATLRQTYQDAHPDVVKVRHQIDDLHEHLRPRNCADSRAAQLLPIPLLLRLMKGSFTTRFTSNYAWNSHRRKSSSTPSGPVLRKPTSNW